LVIDVIDPVNDSSSFFLIWKQEDESL